MNTYWGQYVCVCLFCFYSCYHCEFFQHQKKCVSHLSFLVLNVIQQNNQECERRWTGQSENTNRFPVLQWISLGISVKVNGKCIKNSEERRTLYKPSGFFPFWHLNHWNALHANKHLLNFFINSKGSWIITGLRYFLSDYICNQVS